MAVLGDRGKLLLRREAPDACIVNPEALDPIGNVLLSLCDGYWTGDHISSDCLPVGDGIYPPKPTGYATYFGGKPFVGQTVFKLQALVMSSTRQVQSITRMGSMAMMRNFTREKVMSSMGKN